MALWWLEVGFGGGLLEVGLGEWLLEVGFGGRWIVIGALMEFMNE